MPDQYIVYSIYMLDNALNRKDQKTYAAGDTDDEPEVLESVEVRCYCRCFHTDVTHTQRFLVQL